MNGQKEKKEREKEGKKERKTEGKCIMNFKNATNSFRLHG